LGVTCKARHHLEQLTAKGWRTRKVPVHLDAQAVEIYPQSAGSIAPPAPGTKDEFSGSLRISRDGSLNRSHPQKLMVISNHC
jgi:hypothetical protein